jgi:imidazolonepropionase-like amidohydrolase
VTTVLDMGTDAALAGSLRPGAPGRADLRSATLMITAPGGHGTEYGFPIPTLAAAKDAAAFVRARVAEGADYIKVIYDDGSAYGIRFATFDRKTLGAVIAAAHALGKAAVVHIGTRADAQAAFEAGADGLAHLFLDRAADPAFVALVQQRRGFVVPTLSVLQGIAGGAPGAALAADPRLAPYLDAAAASGLGARFPRPKAALDYGVARTSVRLLAAARVPILAGTDAPNPGTTHGASLHGELALLVDAGLTPSQALAAATAITASRFGLADRGRIALGLRADLLLVRGDPTSDIHATRDIVGVWAGGVAVDRAAWLARRNAERADAERRLSAPAPPGSERAVFADFEDGKPTARFGAGLQVSTDALFGGSSTATLRALPGGAGSARSLEVAGRVHAGAGDQPRWSGVMFWPGAQPMAPANLGAKRELAFRARADGRRYTVMLFSASRGAAPAILEFESTKAWTRHAFPLARFGGIDPRELSGIFIGATAPGDFTLLVDDLELR